MRGYLAIRLRRLADLVDPDITAGPFKVVVEFDTFEEAMGWVEQNRLGEERVLH